MRIFLITLGLGVLAAIAVFLLIQFTSDSVDVERGDDPTVATDDMNDDDGLGDTDQVDEMDEENEPVRAIGTSVDGNDIMAYHYGEGDTKLLFVGGIHGGYSWNTALVAYELMDWLESNPDAIPDNVEVTVIPVMNPDGLEAVTGTTGVFSASDVSGSESQRAAARFNANNVDLNRNFDCDWQSEGTWQSRTVSGGDAPFSEPESAAVQSFVQSYNPDAVVVWYAAAGGVYASSCHNDVLAETRTLTNTYASAAGYRAYEEFDFYEITGDMVNWLAKERIPAISVLLTTHQSTEWSKNRAGIEALLEYYAANE